MSVFLVLFVTSLALILPFYILYKPPALLIAAFQYRWPDVLFRVSTRDKVVALTIDDAPSMYTPEILDILSKYDATATFFVIGSQAQTQAERALLTAIIEQGSELGNHAMHDEPSRSLPATVLAQQITEVDDLIQETYDAAAQTRSGRYFRPGSGLFSSDMRQLVQGLAYRMVLGSVYPHDPQVPYAWLNARHILDMVRPGAVIICHDRRSWTAPMLSRVLERLRERGYRVTSITRLLQQTNHSP